MRANVPQGFVIGGGACGEGFSRGDMEIVTTSGTSDERVSVVWHQPWWDRSEREASRLNATLARIFEVPHREAVLTTPLCAGTSCHLGESSMEERTLDRLLFLNQSPDPTSWNARTVERMAGELRSFCPQVIEADPAYLALLSRACIDGGIDLHRPACIVLTYEWPSRIHYRWIRRAFPGVPVVSSYGSTETGHVFTQCEHGVFHQNTATCYVEIQPVRDHGDDGIGRLLVTTLDNPWFCLIRFDVGDLVRSRTAGPCACGRTDGVAVDAVEGRVRDLTFTTGGGAVTLDRLDSALGVVESLTGYHVAQEAHGRYVVRFSAVPGAERRAGETVPEILRALYGEAARIETRHEQVLPPEQSGKFRLACASASAVPGEIFG